MRKNLLALIPFADRSQPCFIRLYYGSDDRTSTG